MGASHEAAAEVVSRVWERFDRGIVADSVMGLGLRLRKATRSEYLNRVRSEKRAAILRTHLGQSFDADGDPWCGQYDVDPHQQIEAKEWEAQFIAEVVRIVRNCGPDAVTIVHMILSGACSLKQVSDELGMPYRYVWGQFDGARATLAAWFRSHAIDAPPEAVQRGRLILLLTERMEDPPSNGEPPKGQSP
jgi:hypothetical protein